MESFYVLAIEENRSFSFLSNDNGIRTFDSIEEAESDRQLEEVPEAIYIAHVQIDTKGDWTK